MKVNIRFDFTYERALMKRVVKKFRDVRWYVHCLREDWAMLRKTKITPIPVRDIDMSFHEKPGRDLPEVTVRMQFYATDEIGKACLDGRMRVLYVLVPKVARAVEKGTACK